MIINISVKDKKGENMTQHIRLYSKENCHLCDIAKEELEEIKKIYDLTYEEIDIYKDDELLELYSLMIPVVEYNEDIIQFGQIDSYTIVNFLKNKKITK